MGVPKLKNFPPLKKADQGSKNQTTEDKQKIEVLRNAISEKLKSPELAKKAAQILSEYVASTPPKEKKNK